MARRRLTIKRLDPWSVLKFGAFANVVLYAVFLLVAGVVWFIVDRLQLVDQACEIALDVGFTSCGVNAGNLFQVLALLGAMWVIVQTAVLVFLAFLHNLIADLTGGLVIGVIDDGASDGNAAARNAAPITASSPPSGRALAARSGRSPDGGHSAPPQAGLGQQGEGAQPPRGSDPGAGPIDETRGSGPPAPGTASSSRDERLFG
ncbi:MAG: DUF3566 domain-containing protein [Nitriliruptoraceae bacterium]